MWTKYRAKYGGGLYLPNSLPKGWQKEIKSIYDIEYFVKKVIDDKAKEREKNANISNN